MSNACVRPHHIARLGRRIVVVGASGSGKTLVAQALASALKLTYICNDAIIWRDHWTPTPRLEQLDEFERATRATGWTFDGNVGNLQVQENRLILDRADTLVWLDLPKLDVMRQLILRTLRRSWHREVLWHGNTENWRTSFASRESILWWSWRTHALRRRQYTAAFIDPRLAHLIKIRLRSRAAVDRWLMAISQNCK